MRSAAVSLACCCTDRLSSSLFGENVLAQILSRLQKSLWRARGRDSNIPRIFTRRLFWARLFSTGADLPVRSASVHLNPSERRPCLLGNCCCCCCCCQINFSCSQVRCQTAGLPAVTESSWLEERQRVASATGGGNSATASRDTECSTPTQEVKE